MEEKGFKTCYLLLLIFRQPIDYEKEGLLSSCTSIGTPNSEVAVVNSKPKPYLASRHHVKQNQSNRRKRFVEKRYANTHRRKIKYIAYNVYWYEIMINIYYEKNEKTITMKRNKIHL